MKIGSLVECEWTFKAGCKEHQEYKVPVPKNIYTVREIRDENPEYGLSGTIVLLEELLNPAFEWKGRNDEAGFPIEGFREIQPPMEVSIEELLVELV